MNRIDRLVGLILHLQSRRTATASEMAEHFGLSVRTIYRDMRALGEAGVPVLAEAGVGYSLLKGYHMPPVNFSEEEAYALLTSGMFLQYFSDPSINRHVASALDKMRAVLLPADRDRVLRLEQGLGVAATPVLAGQTDLVVLQKALSHCRVVRFSYQGYGRQVAQTRTVEPLGLVHYLGRWHLIAWCRLRGDYRDFRADRLRDLDVLPEKYPPRGDFSLSGYLRQAMPVPELRARVFFATAGVERARREWWLGVEEARPAPGGEVLSLRVLDWAHLASWLLAFGREAVVLEPASLKALLVELALDAAEHHRREEIPGPPG